MLWVLKRAASMRHIQKCFNQWIAQNFRLSETMIMANWLVPRPNKKICVFRRTGLKI